MATNQKKDREFLLRLEEAFEEAFSDEEELDKLLRHQGYDPIKDVEEGVTLIKRLLFEKKLERSKSKMERIKSLIQSSADRVNSFRSADIDKLLTNIIGGKEPSLQAQFRNYKELSEEDKKGIIEDSEFLEEIQRILDEDDD